MKHPLKDLTFLIPIRIDSIERLENVLAVTRYLNLNFSTNIMVLESSLGTNQFLKRLLQKNVTYISIIDDDPIFYRTHFLNLMTAQVTTPFLAIWDADAIVKKDQIIESINQLRTKEYDISFPYDGTFLDTSKIIRDIFIEHLNIKTLTENIDKMRYLYGSNQMGGGGILVNTQKYKDAGMENEHFYGWGPEDGERWERWIQFGYNIHRSQGYMFHLTHPRDMNGKYNSLVQMAITNCELERTKNSSLEELKFRISKWMKSHQLNT